MPQQPLKQYKKGLKLFSLAISAILAFSCISCTNNPEDDKTSRDKKNLFFGRTYDYNNVLVAYVADGDTIKLEDGSWVRLIGIDSPEYHESEKLFRQAKQHKKDAATIKKLGALSYGFAKELLENKRVRLEFDVEKRDKYRRLLAYVFLREGDIFANARIVEYGYAQIMTIPPNVKYADLLIKLQYEAKQRRRGLWAQDY